MRENISVSPEVGKQICIHAGRGICWNSLSGGRRTADHCKPDLCLPFPGCARELPHSGAGGESRRAAAPRSARETRGETDRRGWEAACTGDQGHGLRVEDI